MISFQLGDWDDVDDATRTALASDAQSMAALARARRTFPPVACRGDADRRRGTARARAWRIAAQADDVQHGAPAHVARAELLAAARATARGDRRRGWRCTVPTTPTTPSTSNPRYDSASRSRPISPKRHAPATTMTQRPTRSPWPSRSSSVLAFSDQRGGGTSRRAPRGELASVAAEHRRLDGVPDVDACRLAVETWHEIGEPFPEARSRVRLAEVLLATQAPRAEIEAQLRAAAVVADRLRGVVARADIDRVARWARVDMDTAAESTTSPGEVPTPEPNPSRSRSRRAELQVLAFVADGRTNRQIAEALFINQKTASVHVSNILSKLGVANRAEAAAVAHRVGLAGD